MNGKKHNLLLLQTHLELKPQLSQTNAASAEERKEWRAAHTIHAYSRIFDTSRTLPATLSSERIYISPALSNFFKLPVAEPKLVPTNFFSYAESSSSNWAGFPPSMPREVVVAGILRAGRATNSYGVPDKLSSLEVELAVGVWLSEGVVRLEMMLRL